MKGRIFDFQRTSSVDGPGLRSVVFFKGCNLHCLWCHNPESQSSLPQLAFFSNRCKGCERCRNVCPTGMQNCILCGKCTEVCPEEARILYGKEVTAEELIKKIRADLIFFRTSGGGVTFSGGECMLQLSFLKELLIACREEKISTAVDTAGNVPWTSFEEILPYTDLFLYDVKVMDSKKHQLGTGVNNTLILSNLQKLLSKKCRVWIRMPIIPHFNDEPADIIALRNFLKELSRPEKIELLPYHRMGEAKYAALGMNRPCYQVPSSKTIQMFSCLLNSEQNAF